MAASPEPPDVLTLYSPHPESQLSRTLIRGSAIVGLTQLEGSVRIHFEGNALAADQLRRYRDRVRRAADHLLFNFPAGYPTKARQLVDPREVSEIGILEVKTGEITIGHSASELAWWIDEADLIDLGLIVAR